MRKVTKMCKGNPRIAKKYKKSILDTKGNIYLLKNWISDALELNKQLCYIMSDINNNDLFECSHTCDLLNQANVRLLLQPEVIQDRVDLHKHTQFLKQQSDLWYDIQKQSRVTGSTIYRSLGLDTLK